MATKVAVYRIANHHRSEILCSAAIKGLRTCGENVIERYSHDYKGIEADIAVFYGLQDDLPKVFKDYSANAKAVYIDLGYWGRREGGRWSGYHKLCINSRHPNNYFQNIKHDDRRIRRLGVKLQPWRTSRSWKIDNAHILLAGMGDKGAKAEGFRPECWERGAIKEIRNRTRRHIIYRPKPSWKTARPIAGVGYSPRTVDVEDALNNCHAVVTHHSNVAVDAIVRGIPVFVWKGVATLMGNQDWEKIDTPDTPDGREQWMNDLAYTQWSVQEIADGLAWKHLKEEGLV